MRHISGPKCFVIHHTQDKRTFATAKCLVLPKSANTTEVRELILAVDAFGGNQDPYVWHWPWMYSYCKSHALRNKILPGSILFFVYGDRSSMRKGQRVPLFCDTVFVVENKEGWDRRDPVSGHVTDIPSSLEPFRESAWHAHLKWPLAPYRQHPSVAYTYLAKNVELRSEQPFSFLPYVKSGREWIPYDLEPLLQGHWSGIPESRRSQTPGLAIAGGGPYARTIEVPYEVGASIYGELRMSADTLVVRVLTQGKYGGSANC